MNAISTQDVNQIISAFGGLRPMAAKTGIAVTTIQGWKKRGRIPDNRIAEIRNAASKHGIPWPGQDDKAVSSDERPQKAGAPGKREKSTAEGAPASAPASQQSTRPPGQTPSKKPRAKTYTHLQKLRRASARRAAVTAAIVSLLVLGAALLFLGPENVRDVKQTNEKITQTQQKMSGIENRQDELEQHQNTLATRIPKGLRDKMDEISEKADMARQTAIQAGREVRELSSAIAEGDVDQVLERLKTLETRVEGLGQMKDLARFAARLEALEQSQEGQMVLQQAIRELQPVVKDLQGRTDDLEQSLEAAKKRDKELARVLEGIHAQDVTAAAMLIALNQFRTALNRGNVAFEEDLQLLRQTVGEEDEELLAAINRLAPYAESGVLSTGSLKKELESLSGEIVTAKLRGEDVSVRDQALTRLSEIVKVTKEDATRTPEAARTEALIARAQTQLDQGDVEAAVATLEKLDGEAEKAAEPWMQKARGTAAAMGLESRLNEKLMQRLSGLQSGNPEQIREMLSDPLSLFGLDKSRNLKSSGDGEFQIYRQGGTKGSGGSGLFGTAPDMPGMKSNTQ